ncbi:MAG: hypothetical protein M1836_006409 [Candelina mexicana]|nr:MAG: hypothetical protein M1836_006409 [Candelina mexicana]
MADTEDSRESSHTNNRDVSKLMSLVETYCLEFVRCQWVDFTGSGEKDSLIPDWSTLVACHYQPGHAAVMCYIDEGGRGLHICPRYLLQRIEREAKVQYEMTFLVGIEVEFYLTPSAESTEPVKDIKSYCSTASLRTPYLSVLEDSVRALEKANIPVWTFHTESAAALFEISTEPMTPLRAADALVYMHEAIKSSAVKHGFHATMHPKPFDKTQGVGQPMHISLSKQIDDDSFLAGVLDSVPAISAISMPNYDSYLRSEFAGGEWVTWDYENRSTSIRKLRQAYWEFRFIDATTNAYLSLATILGVGMAAWAQRTPLKMSPLCGRKAKLDEASRRELGVEKAVPKGLKEAIEALKQDEAVKSVLGEEVWRGFIEYKEKEEEMLAKLTLQERRKMMMQIF